MSALRFWGVLGPFTRRMLAVVMAGQAIVIFFGALVARAVADVQGEGRATALLWLGSGLAVLSVVAAGLMRRPFGVTLGWLVQVGTLASATVVPTMGVVGVVFLVIWVFSMLQGRGVDQKVLAAKQRAADPA